MVAPGRRVRRWTLAGVLLVAAVIGVIGAALIRVPYYALRPGMVRPAEPMIDLGGGTADPDAGEVAFATVAVDGRVNLLQALAGWLDDTVAVVPEAWVLRGQTPQQNVAHNQVLMADSKQLAVDSALLRLGLARPAGAEVAEIVAGSPAEAVLAVGDVITAIDGRPTTTASALVERVRAAGPGDELVLTVARGAGRAASPLRLPGVSTDEVAVRLVADAAEPGRARLGVNARDAFDVDYDGDVRIDSGQVGGPSAGLAFTLGVIDLLSAGDLTGGRRVAATGTIATDGTVGAVGGIEQKAVAVRRSGVKLFLVPAVQPADELAAARELAGDVELVPVGTLGDALAVLASRGGAEVALAAVGS